MKTGNMYYVGSKSFFICFKMDAAPRRDDRKPSTPPVRDQQRNSRIIPQPQQQRKPEDLDVLAAQLNELASSPRNQRGGGATNVNVNAAQNRDRQRVPSQEGGGPSPQMRAGAVGQNGRILSAQPQPPPMVEDDDSSDDDEVIFFLFMILAGMVT